jgi:hypothetical protein
MVGSCVYGTADLLSAGFDVSGYVARDAARDRLRAHVCHSTSPRSALRSAMAAPTLFRLPPRRIV